MGCSFSCMPSPPKFKSIRIVGLNGLVEEIEYPITVAEVTGKEAGKHFLFSQPQVLGAAPLKVDAPLEGGRIYFLLPSTLFESSVSPVELAPIVRKLASIAQSAPAKSKSKSQSTPPCSSPPDSLHKSGKSRSWKPILSTIRERSFNRRSESDLQAEDANIHS